jgi:VCBS repeat-containing protein
MTSSNNLQVFKTFIKKYGFTLASVVCSLALIFVAYSAIHNPPVAHADCDWETVQTNLDGSCPEGFDDIGGGWCGAFVNCSSGGDPNGGGSGPQSCPADYTVNIGCPLPNYSGSNTETHSYNLTATCDPSQIVDDGSGDPTCQTPTYTCTDYISSTSDTCVPEQFCRDQNGVTTPAPNNDPANCPPIIVPEPDCTVDQTYNCDGWVKNEAPAPGDKWSYAVTVAYPLVLENSVPECAWLWPPNVDVEDNPDCATNPVGPSCDDRCVSNNPVVPSGPAPSDISVTVPAGISWTIAPDGYSGTGNTVSPIAVDPTTGDNSYTLNPGGSCVSPTVTSSVDGVSGGSTVVLPTNDAGAHNVSFNVTCAGAFSYTIGQPANVTVAVGSSNTTSIAVTLTGGSAQQVSFNTSGAPAGVSAIFTSCTPNSNCTSTGTITVGAGVSPGTYPVSVTSSPAPAQTKSFNIVVTPGPLSPGNGGTTSGTPNPASTGQQVTWTTCAATGGTPPYTYTWNGTDVTNQTTNTNTLLFTYTTPGTKTMNPPSITDSSVPAQTVSCNAGGSVKVVLNATFQEF